MRGYGRRVAGAGVIALLLVLLAVPMVAHAGEPAAPSATGIAIRSADETGTVDPIESTGDGASSEDPAADDSQADPSDSTETETVETDESDAALSDPADATEEQSGTAGAVNQISSQANPDTRAAIETILTVRKRGFDSTAASLQRNINRLAVIIRRLDAAGANTWAARVRLAQARTALDRARAAERVAVSRYRSILTAEDAGSAYASARAAARTSSTLLERARIKVLTAARTLRAILKNVTV